MIDPNFSLSDLEDRDFERIADQCDVEAGRIGRFDPIRADDFKIAAAIIRAVAEGKVVP